MTQVVTVNGVGKFELPENRLLAIFEGQCNVAILDAGVAGKAHDNLGIVDSVHTRGYRGESERREAIVDLIVRNGGKPAPALQ